MSNCVNTGLHVSTGRKGGWEIDRTELKKQRKSYSYPAIIQSRTRHLIYSSLRERNEREWEAGGDRERKRWERGGSRKEIISSHDWCAFMTLSTHTSRETRWTKLSFMSHVINSIPKIVRQQRPWHPKHHQCISGERKHKHTLVWHYRDPWK